MMTNRNSSILESWLESECLVAYTKKTHPKACKVAKKANVIFIKDEEDQNGGYSIYSKLEFDELIEELKEASRRALRNSRKLSNLSDEMKAKTIEEYNQSVYTQLQTIFQRYCKKKQVFWKDLDDLWKIIRGKI
jgi:hypothetical protein